MTDLEFRAETVSITVEDGACVVGFADCADEPQQYLLLQRSLQDDDQDIALGLNTYYWEVGTQAASGHGGLRRATLTPKMLTIEIRQPNRSLPYVKAIKIFFDASLEEQSQLIENLQFIFRDSDCELATH